MIEDLYTVKDVQRVRELLLKEQHNLDLITHLLIPPKQACLDHRHDSEQLVRGVLHRQSNAVLGKLEGVWTRYLSYWYPHDLPTFLRQSADYLEDTERNPDKRYRHPNWIKKVKTFYNSLNAKQQNQVLAKLNSPEGSNPAKRKELFSKVILQRELGYDKIQSVIQQVKENHV